MQLQRAFLLFSLVKPVETLFLLSFLLFTLAMLRFWDEKAGFSWIGSSVVHLGQSLIVVTRSSGEEWTIYRHRWPSYSLREMEAEATGEFHGRRSSSINSCPLCPICSFVCEGPFIMWVSSLKRWLDRLPSEWPNRGKSRSKGMQGWNSSRNAHLIHRVNFGRCNSHFAFMKGDPRDILVLLS